MNELTPTDDELVSSYLDGEATFDEVARVESDPPLRARAAEMQAARDLVATPVRSLQGSDLERVIGAALEASATSDDVIDLRLEAVRRQRFRQRLVAVAAAVVVLVVAVPTLLALDSFGDGDDTDSFATSTDTGDEAGAAGGDDGEAGGDDVALLQSDDAAAADDSAEAAAEAAADTGDDSADGDDGDGADVDMAARTLDRAEILPEDLGSIDGAALLEAAKTAWQAYAAEPTAGDPDTTADELAARHPCAREILDPLGPTVSAIDLGGAILDDVETTVAVVVVDGTTATLFVAAPPACVVEQLGELTSAP